METKQDLAVVEESSEGKYFNTGSGLLNLALTGDIRKGYTVGKITNIFGDSSSGKTLLTLEAAIAIIGLHGEGSKYNLIDYIDCEAAFNYAYAKSLGLDMRKVDMHTDVRTIGNFVELVKAICAKKQGSLIILDSLDALSSQEEIDRDFEKGSYNMGRQKDLGIFFRTCSSLLVESDVSLIIISQIRDNVGAGLYEPKYRRSGGKALDFYCTNILRIVSTGKLVDRATDLEYGVATKVLVTKNKESVPRRVIEFNILHTFGVADIDSLVAYYTGRVKNLPGLVEDGKWLKISDTLSFYLEVKASGWYSICLHRVADGKEEYIGEYEKKLRALALSQFIDSNEVVYAALYSAVQKIWELSERRAFKSAVGDRNKRVPGVIDMGQAGIGLD